MEGSMANSDAPRGCGCRAYHPGHSCHVIQATRANSDPTPWFRATVTVLNQEEVTVEYEDGSMCRLWRHGGFDERVTVGTALLVCERWLMVSIVGSDGRDQLSATPLGVRTGCRRIEAGKWVAGIVSIASGEGVDILHVED
jgi:hypothetical protein